MILSSVGGPGSAGFVNPHGLSVQILAANEPEMKGKDGSVHTVDKAIVIWTQPRQKIKLWVFVMAQRMKSVSRLV